MFIRFDEDGCVCCCSIDNKKCNNEDGCDEYVAKLTKVNRSSTVQNTINSIKDVNKACNKLESEVSKAVRKFNRINNRILRGGR